MNEPGWAADAARGHDHPDSEAARRIRIEDAQADARLARNGMALAQDLLRRYARSQQDAGSTLNALASGLNSPIIKSTDIENLVQHLDELSAIIEQRGAV